MMRAGNSAREYFHIFLIHIVVIYFVSSVFCSTAEADISSVYITTMCDPIGGVAQIAIDRVDEGDTPPENSRLLSSIHDHQKPTAPVKMCSLGKKREIALLGSLNLEHPREDELIIYIGTSGSPYRVNVSNILDTYFINIRAMTDDYYVSIEECENKGDCHKSVHTDPSFDCRKASLVAEKMICNVQDLSELDIKLNNAYIFNLSRSENKKSVIEGQVKWIRVRDVFCGIPKNPDDWKISKSYPLNPIDCLIKYYTDRINVLDGLLSPK